MDGYFRSDSLTNSALLVVLILANLAWLLNPHACCPRPTATESGLSGENSLESNCCSMHHDQLSDELEAHDEKFDPTDNSINLSIFPDDQFSKGVHSSISESNPTSASLLQLLYAPMISEELIINDSEIPDSAIIPRLKKPPCTSSIPEHLPGSD
jgi:hypothetical protein